jgi:arabinose-5-phosphate isomerase
MSRGSYSPGDELADTDVRSFARAMVHDEARALEALADSIGDDFERAVALILAAPGKLIVGGLGKSGHIGRKIAATFASTGTTAIFLHLAEAMHGDLGMAAKGDVALLLSQSGSTAELAPVIEHFGAVGIAIIAVTANPGSMLAEAASAPLILPHWAEVGPEAVAPTTSTTMTLALGDALAMTVMRAKGFTRADFGRLHPGGSLGLRLRAVRLLMHSGDALPLTRIDSSMHTAIVEMSAKRLGVVGVVDAAGQLVGVITDGDLRRNVERGLEITAGDVMSSKPKTIAPDALVDDALNLFEEHRITTVFVVEPETTGVRPIGVLHIHDIHAVR